MSSASIDMKLDSLKDKNITMEEYIVNDKYFVLFSEFKKQRTRPVDYDLLLSKCLEILLWNRKARVLSSQQGIYSLEANGDLSEDAPDLMEHWGHVSLLYEVIKCIAADGKLQFVHLERSEDPRERTAIVSILYQLLMPADSKRSLAPKGKKKHKERCFQEAAQRSMAIQAIQGHLLAFIESENDARCGSCPGLFISHRGIVDLIWVVHDCFSLVKEIIDPRVFLNLVRRSDQNLPVFSAALSPLMSTMCKNNPKLIRMLLKSTNPNTSAFKRLFVLQILELNIGSAPLCSLITFLEDNLRSGHYLVVECSSILITELAMQSHISHLKLSRLKLLLYDLERQNQTPLRLKAAILSAMASLI